MSSADRIRAVDRSLQPRYRPSPTQLAVHAYSSYIAFAERLDPPGSLSLGRMVKIVSSKPYVGIRPGWNIAKLAMSCQKWSIGECTFTCWTFFPLGFDVAWVDLVQGYI